MFGDVLTWAQLVVLMEVPTPLWFLLGAKASHPHGVPA